MATLEQRDAAGRTALFVAATFGHARVMRLLLAAGFKDPIDAATAGCGFTAAEQHEEGENIAGRGFDITQPRWQDVSRIIGHLSAYNACSWRWPYSDSAGAAPMKNISTLKVRRVSATPNPGRFLAGLCR